MNKFISFLFAFLLLFGSVLTVSAKPTDTSNDDGIPEVSGDYKDPKHDGVRVRVFVHEAKQKLVTSTLAVCNDSDSTAPVHPTGWHLPSNVNYNLNTSSVPASVGSSNLPTIASDAYQTWQTALGSKVNFNRGNNTFATRSAFDGQNIVAWGRTNGGALAVTYTRYYTATGLVADVDVIFNKKFPWSWTPYTLGGCGASNSYDAQNILAHELGHWVGLDDEYDSAYVDNTMYGYGSKAEIKKDTLTTGDKANLGTIYP